MRTTIDLPAPLLENAKQRAAENGMTLSRYLQAALQAHLALRCVDPCLEFKLHTVRGRLVNRDLDLDRTSAVIASEDELEFTRS